MKILCDPILTSEPNRCSTYVIFIEFVRRTLAERQDVFFYWVIPSYLTDDQRSQLPQDERIRYIPQTRSKFRVRDYLTLTTEFEDLIAWDGDAEGCWDFDVLLTVRAGLIPTMRLLMNSPRNGRWSWLKQVWLIDVMPMVSFKTTVPNHVPEVHDRWTIEGYLAADRVFVTSHHEKPGIIREAQRHFAPSLVRGLSKKIENVITSQFETFDLKPLEKRFRSDGGMPFGLGYIGRMEKANKIDDISRIMEQAWIPRGDRVKMLVCTVSSVTRVFDEKIVDVRHPQREEFWQIVRDEMHAFIYMPQGGGFSLSVIEPLMLGTPVITLRRDDFMSMLGPYYPFYADGPAEVQALVKWMIDDYAGCYARFAGWHADWFEPTYRKRGAEDLIYPKLARAIDEFQAMLEARRKDLASLENNALVEVLDEYLQGTGRTMFGAIACAAEDGRVDRQVGGKIGPGFRHGWAPTFTTPWNPFRVGLQLFCGYEDASVRTGHLRKRS